jgi:hypothetical protein
MKGRFAGYFYTLLYELIIFLSEARIVNPTLLSARTRKLSPIPAQHGEHLTPRPAAPQDQTIPPPIAARLIPLRVA